MADKPIRVYILEGDFAVMPNAGLLLPFCVQQQIKLLDTEWGLHGQLGVPLMDFLLAYSLALKEMMDLKEGRGRGGGVS